MSLKNNKEYNQLNHLMLDFETLGTSTNSVLTKISIMGFRPSDGEIGFSYSEHINIQSCLDKGMEISADTLEFWFNQNEEARKRAFNFSKDVKTLDVVCSEVHNFIKNVSEPKIWGKGPTFDISKLKNMYKLCGFEMNWGFWNERCVRTELAGIKSAKDIPFEGVKHDSYDDCKHQIKQVVHALNKKFD